MFYRHLRDDLLAGGDLSNTYKDYPIFIIAGSPIIKSLPLDLLEASRLPTLALNNAPYTYNNPTMWLTADRPECFGGHIYARADIIKFAYMNHRDEVVKAELWNPWAPASVLGQRQSIVAPTAVTRRMVGRRK